ncbi:MAG: hypothetical protein ACI4WH_01010 [Oscillospiraceae bacterium]
MAKHRYLNLNMGLVKENFIIIDKKDMPIWKERGFEPIRKYPIFGYRRKFSEITMLSKPLDINQFGVDSLKNSKIIDICPYFGTYGMGGPGFFGFKLESYFGIRWLVYCIWNSGESILIDDRIIECHPKYNHIYNPYIQNSEKSVNDLKDLLYDWRIKDISLTDTHLKILLLDKTLKEHTIYTSQVCDKFPEQGGTGKKRKSFEDGKMSDYWLVIYDGTELSV